MKKCLAFLLAFVMLFGLTANVQAGPGGTLTFAMDNVEIAANATTVSIPVSLQNPGATSISILVTYETPLTFVGANFSGIIEPISHVSPVAGTRLITWSLDTSPVTHSGVVFELEFSVAATDLLANAPVVAIAMGGPLQNMHGSLNTTVVGATSTVTRASSEVSINVELDEDDNITIGIYPPEVEEEAEISVDNEGNIVITLPPGTDVDEENISLPGSDWGAEVGTDGDGNTIVTVIPPPGSSIVEYPPGSGILVRVLWGDVNNDRVVDAVDALLIDQWLVNNFLVEMGFAPNYDITIIEAVANVTMTGTISAFDSLRIRQYVVDRGLTAAGLPAQYNAVLGPR